MEGKYMLAVDLETMRIDRNHPVQLLPTAQHRQKITLAYLRLRDAGHLLLTVGPTDRAHQPAARRVSERRHRLVGILRHTTPGTLARESIPFDAVEPYQQYLLVHQYFPLKNLAVVSVTLLLWPHRSPDSSRPAACAWKRAMPCRLSRGIPGSLSARKSHP